MTKNRRCCADRQNPEELYRSGNVFVGIEIGRQDLVGVSSVKEDLALAPGNNALFLLALPILTSLRHPSYNTFVSRMPLC